MFKGLIIYGYLKKIAKKRLISLKEINKFAHVYKKKN